LSQMQVFALQGIGLEREVYVGAQVAFQSSLTLLAVFVRPIALSGLIGLSAYRIELTQLEGKRIAFSDPQLR
jgi:hypothetical protein